ncbi:galactose-binding domain-like protein [Rhodocollybia butyracea]|uniref:Galactose-binding domain-like protein n=1 Tax=Rhodocollybia butyracea TaxID=206335 RepID=A0A9P5PC46_9AGAR|nr:galactose-binding domain-like protein [Rhodocollybia butyracea]
MSFEQIGLENFNTFSGSTDAFTELSSVALGGRVLSVSDEFFAEAFNLLLVGPAPSLKGQFGPNGALYSGWESRRHNPTYDWCIIKLGAPGKILGFDIDTTHFNGNEAPEASVEALYDPSSNDPNPTDSRWTEILPKVKLGPSSRHLFTIPNVPNATFVKLNMYPDGGIARFRVYGNVEPVMPTELTELFDLAHVFAGGRVEFVSDQHFGVGSNLILPGRGKDMGDGWETKRSRSIGHKDWVIIRLHAAALAVLEQVELDTAHFKGNFPESCEIHAVSLAKDVNWTVERSENENWTLILPRTKLGPHRQHYFQLENVENMAFTHVRVTIYPDGGLKRVRILGRRANVEGLESLAVKVALPGLDTTPVPVASKSTSSKSILPALPLTPEAFAPFGQVIQAYGDHTAAPKGTKITPANAGTASKFHKLSLLASSYPPDAQATAGLSVYRCQPLKNIDKDGTTELTVLERHSFTNQAFIPMGCGPEDLESLADPSHRYLVVVAKNGEDDKPDLKTLRAFIANTAQGIVYSTGIWHQPMTGLDKELDFTCVETQIGNGGKEDCEIVELETSVRLRLL